MEERTEKMQFDLWVNWERRVVSFSKENGFEKVTFPTHEEKMKYALERSNEGFKIQ